MSGDSDNELESSGDHPSPVEPPSAENPFRPFRSWASTYEQPSAWSRFRSRLASLFGRKHPGNNTGEHVADAVIDTDATAPVDAVIDLNEPAPREEPMLEPGPIDPAYQASVDAAIIFPAPEETNAELRLASVEVEREPPRSEPPPFEPPQPEPPAFEPAAQEPAAVAPPDDFRFPWTRESDPPAAVEAVSDTTLPHEPPAETFISTFEHAVETKPKAPGFFARMFGRKTKAAPLETQSVEPAADEPLAVEAVASETIADPAAETTLDAIPDVDAAAMEAPIVEEAPQAPEVLEETFSSMEEALPTADDAGVAVEDLAPPAAPAAPAAPAPPDAPLKRGFFARLFGRRAETPDLEIEVHEDRIQAAAQALDAVGEEQFESFDGTLRTAEPPPREVFESVEEALPAVDALPQPPLQLAEEAPVEVAPPLSESDMRFAPPVVEPAPAPPMDLPFVEDVAGAEIGDRKTAEVPVSEMPDVQAALRESTGVTEEAVAGAFDGASTLEIEEKTDEFEIVVPEPERAETIEAPKKSWTTSLMRLFRRGDTQVETVGAEKEEEKEHPHFLLSKFRAFYNEIIRFQHQKSEFTAGFATAIVTEYTADLSPDAAAEGLSKRLGELLELQAAEAKWMGGEAADRYPDAQYAMAALADEIFSHTEWEGQAAWPKYSLERKMFQSNAADVDVFRRIDRLLKDAPDSVIARDLARVYLLVLAAGFQGKWRPFGLLRPIAEYRRRLYEYIHGADPMMLYSDDRRVFPEAASRTLEGTAVARFSAMQRWAAILVFLVISYTVIAHVAWTRVSADLKDVTSRIKGASTAGVR